MALDLPPEMPPVLMALSKANELRRVHGASVYSGTIAAQNIEVLALPYLTAEQIARLAKAAPSASQFIVNLAKVYRLNGNLLVQVLYRKSGNTVYVYAVQTELAAIKGHALVRDHFEDLIGDKDLTLTEFEKARVMADLGTQRRGVDYSVSYSLSPDYTQTTMHFESTIIEDFDRHQFTLDVGNQGNRFAGRDFGGLGWRYWSKGGVEFNVNYLAALSDKAFEETDTSYDGLVIGINRPFVSGLYGIGLARTEYRSSRTDTVFQSELPQLCDLVPTAPVCELGSDSKIVSRLDANTTVASLNGEHILAAGAGRRWVLSESVSVIDDEVLDPAREEPIVDERYGKAVLGIKYLYGGRGALGLNEGHYSLSVAGGFGGGNGSLDRAPAETEDETAQVGPATRTADYVQLNPSVRFRFGLAKYFVIDLLADGSFSDGNQVPQQEQYVLGGMDRMSAYLPGVLVGDSGYHGRLAIHGNTRQAGTFQLIPTLFVEQAAVRFEDAEGPAGDTRKLVDAGLRLQCFFGDAGDLELVAARSLSSSNVPEQVLDDAEVSFFARLKLRF